MTPPTDDTTPEREFTIHAIEADIVLNRFGLHIEDGAMYVLDEHYEAVTSIRDDIRAYLDAVKPVRTATGTVYDTYERRVDAVIDAIKHAETEPARQQAAHRAIHDDYAGVLDPGAIDELDSRVHATLAESYDIDENRRLAVRATIDEYGPLVTSVAERLRDAVAATKGQVDSYGDRMAELETKLAGDHEAVEELRELVASYCEAVPKRQHAAANPSESAQQAAMLNPLDDAYALLEDDNQKDPSLIQPLVIRANEGETVSINFVNHLDRPASIHQTSLPYDVKDSDGMAVGRNPDTTAAADTDGDANQVEYTWEATTQGTHFFYDGANQAFDSIDPDKRRNLLARGLFGALIVEPPGTTWVDPQDHSTALHSGVRAVIEPGPESRVDQSYREFVVFYHSPEGTQPEVRWPTKLTEQSTHAINYRCDPTGQRVNDELEDTNREELFYHSWTNGDPGGGDNVYTAYKGDPIKFCFVGASHEENHVHHLHQHRHKEVPQTDAPTIDAQTIGLGDTFEAHLVAGHGPGTVRPDMDFTEAFTAAGAGYTHGTTGDILFHCHLFPHYAEGMWGFMRVLDKRHEFLEPLAETTIVDEVSEPPTEPGTILSADADTPGFPTFVGEAIKAEDGVTDPVGHGAPEPPGLRQPGPRDPVPAEREAFGDIETGAPYADPLEDATRPDQQPTRLVEYEIVVTRAEIAYNDAGDHDPDGIVYVADRVRIRPGPETTADEVVGVTDGWVDIDDAEQVASGAMNPEPLFLRANVGDRVEVKLRNELDTVQLVEQRPFDASIHPHYVGYDVLASDSLPNGFNYYQGTVPTKHAEERPPGDTTDDVFADGQPGNVSRWYADEQGTIYFHDHIFAIKQGVHGMFCGLLVEPQGSRWRDPYSGEPVFSGAKADIIPPAETETDPFREQALHYHDFAPLRTLDGDQGYVNPELEHTINKGTMAINLRSAPYYHRDDADPAYVHSSAVHGDPPTPVVEAYDGDPIRLRVFQGCYEEQHTFAVHGLRTERDGLPAEASVSKYLGTSEAFTFEIPGTETTRSDDAATNAAGLPVRDYLYGSTVVDDLWTGMWGLVRLWGGGVTHLQPLGETAPPGDPIADEALDRMGHPAVDSVIDWREAGQRALHRYSVDESGGLLAELAEPFEELIEAGLELVGLRDDAHYRDRGHHETPLIPADAVARHHDGDPPGHAPQAAVRRSAETGSVREYDVTAFLTEIPYNDYGDHDPYGVVFALDRHVEAIKAGERAPEPLVLRVNEDEQLRVNLTNDLPPFLRNDHPDPEMLVPQEWPRSDRVSLHPLALDYDPQTAAGVTVGFNHDTTVGPGETGTYEWTPTGDIETVCLWDMADLRSTRHHGAFGQVLVESAGALPLAAETAEPAIDGASALVATPDGADVREHALLFADAQFIRNRHDPTNCVVPAGHGGGGGDRPPCTQLPDDTEDQGYGSVNYRSEPFIRRFATNDTQKLVYSSRTHGDPSTPVVEAQADDPVRFHVAAAGDKARGITFHLAGHQWERFPGVKRSPAIGISGQFGPGTGRTLELLGGAGGPNGYPGDYLYQETKQRRRLESGLWGLFRVHAGDETGAVQPLPDRAGDVSLAKRPGYETIDDVDLTGSGETDVLVGVPDSDLGAATAGSVHLFVDSDPAEITHLGTADLHLLGETPNARAGQALAVETMTGGSDSGPRLRITTATGDVTVDGTRVATLAAEPSTASLQSAALARSLRRVLPAGTWPVVSLNAVANAN